MAEVITPHIFAPRASGKIILVAFAFVTSFCATFAVDGTQLTPAIPIVGLKLLDKIHYITPDDTSDA